MGGSDGSLRPTSASSDSIEGGISTNAVVLCEAKSTERVERVYSVDEGVLNYDVEEFIDEGEGIRDERIAEVEMMLDSSNKVIDKLTSQLQSEKVTHQKMMAANRKLVEKLNEKEKDIAQLQKYKSNYWERNLHYALSMIELDKVQNENKVSFLCFRKKKERRRLVLIRNLKDRLTRDINN